MMENLAKRFSNLSEYQQRDLFTSLKICIAIEESNIELLKLDEEGEHSEINEATRNIERMQRILK
jgi:hypothetical protein